MNPAFSDEIDAVFKLSERLREEYGLKYQPYDSDNIGESFSTEDLMDLARMQNIFYPTKFVSHRRIVGWVIVLLKERFIKILDPYLRRRLMRQFEINQFTWNMAQIVRCQSEQICDLQKRIESLESRSH